MPTIAVKQAVSDVERATTSLGEVSPKEAVERLIAGSVEACSEYGGLVVPSSYHPFIAAVHVAFAQHRPLVLSPDMLWLLIAQGFARHVNNNAEEMRPKFVSREEKATITVRRDDFIKGSPENPWNDVLEAFSKEIKEHIGEENHDNIVVSFSTTGAIEKAANEVVLMDSMQNYFEYELLTLCGIPEVSLEGTGEDWAKLHEKTELLGRTYEMQWWTNRLLPTLSQIEANAAGVDSPQLWKDIYKLDNGSGGPFITGWIVDFFPYLQERAKVDPGTGEIVDWQTAIRNPDKYQDTTIDAPNWTFDAMANRGITCESLPGSMSRVPFRWQYLVQSFEMEFLAGFTAITQDSETLAVRPKIGWAVRESASIS